MIALTMALLVGAGTADASPSRAIGLPAIFVAACLDGEAKLSAGRTTPMRFIDLPTSLRQKLRTPASGSVWQIDSPDRSYLYALNYAPGPGVAARVCGLASDSMSLTDANNALDERLAGSTQLHPNRGTQWLRPQDGYNALATTAAEFRVMQVNWLSPTEQHEANRDLGSVDR